MLVVAHALLRAENYLEVPVKAAVMAYAVANTPLLTALAELFCRLCHRAVLRLICPRLLLSSSL